MGILAMNITAFAMPGAAYLNPRAWGGAHGWNLAVWAIDAVAIDGKMRGLFSVLFGASMLLVAERAEAAGRAGWRAHLPRMVVLFVLGVAHGVLLWWGDILAHYAIVGTLAFGCRRWPVPRQLAAAIAALAVQALLLANIPLAIPGLAHALVTGQASAADAADWRSIRDSLGIPSAGSLARDLALHRGGYLPLVASRWAGLERLIVGTLYSTGLETFAFMLIGMAGFRSGFLTGDWSRRAYRRVALVGFGIGVPGFVALATILAARGFDLVAIGWCALVVPVALRPPMILGWAALIVLAMRPGTARWARVAAAGRMAFSNYIGTSLVCTTLFYGYGVGLYAYLGRAALVPVVVAVCALMLLWSRLWLARFRYGPLEWLWRSLARGRLQQIAGPAR